MNNWLVLGRNWLVLGRNWVFLGHNWVGGFVGGSICHIIIRPNFGATAGPNCATFDSCIFVASCITNYIIIYRVFFEPNWRRRGVGVFVVANHHVGYLL